MKELEEDQRDVHTEHCCQRHGCRYMDKNCTVIRFDTETLTFVYAKPQSFMCEMCGEQVEDDWDQIVFTNEVYDIGFAAASQIMQNWIEEHFLLASKDYTSTWVRMLGSLKES